MFRFIGSLFAAIGLLLFVVVQPTAQAQDGDNQADVDAGRTIYEMNCTACHADDGTGVTGRGRSLIGIASQGDRSQHVMSITDGRGGMPAFGSRLSDDEISQVASFVRLTFVAAEEEPAAEEAPAAEEPAAEEEPAEEEPAAAESTAEEEPAEELAFTGSETPIVAIGGLAMVLAGVQLVSFSRRQR